MQTSGFATLPNAIASLAVPFQIPVLMMVSERGTLGEFNIGQSLVARTMRPVLESLAVEHHTLTRLDEVEFIIDRSITQAVATQAPCCFILSPLLTGGKVFAEVRSGAMALQQTSRPPRPGQDDEPLRHHPAAGGPPAARRGGDRRHRLHQFRSLGGGAPAAEFLHAGQHGAGGADRAGRCDGAAAAQGDCAGGRWLDPDAAWVARRRSPPGRRRTWPSSIMDNGTYQITGGQKTATELGADIVAIARGAGIAQSAWAADESAFEELMDLAICEDGPWLIGCRIDSGKPVDTTERDPARIRDQFMRGLGVKR